MAKEKYYIKTYGCQMNVHESEKLAGMLLSLGYEETPDMKDADVILFNTCCIRDGCEKKVFGNLGMLKALKKKKPNLIVGICGCLTQADGRKDYIAKRFPYVNIVFGTHNLNEFKNYLIEYKSNKKNIYDIWEKEKAINEDVDLYRTSGYNAWVNIMYGCNNFCSYCIVPYVRGRERSRNMADIISEVKGLINDGYKTITLLGQNVNSYGNDLADKNTTFAKLLDNLANLEGDFRIKFMTSHPKDLTDEVIDVIAKHEKLAKVIHLPVQSGNNKVLKEMNRRYTREHYLSLVDKIRQKMPDCYLSTDIIVGFPGETEDEFLDTYSLVKEVRYDGVFAFMFSPRTGTVAEKMENQIPLEIKNDRVNRLLNLSKEISKEKTQQLIGKVFDVLIIKDDNNLKAISESGRDIFIENTDNVLPNKYYKCKIIKIANKKIFGELI